MFPDGEVLSSHYYVYCMLSGHSVCALGMYGLSRYIWHWHKCYSSLLQTVLHQRVFSIFNSFPLWEHTLHNDIQMSFLVFHNMFIIVGSKLPMYCIHKINWNKGWMHVECQWLIWTESSGHSLTNEYSRVQWPCKKEWKWYWPQVVLVLPYGCPWLLCPCIPLVFNMIPSYFAFHTSCPAVTE